MEAKDKPNLFSYLDKVLDSEGIKTSNKIAIKVEAETAITILGIGIGLVVFSHLLGVGLRALTTKKRVG